MGLLNRLKDELTAESARARVMPAWSQVRRPRVLAVDDHPAFLALLRAFLVGVDCDLETASNGIAALDMIRRRQPDLVLLDVSMPGPNVSTPAGPSRRPRSPGCCRW